MSWKEKTCEKCKYRVGDSCRRFPPSGDDYPDYPMVRMNSYFAACAEYAEEGQISEVHRDVAYAVLYTPIPPIPSSMFRLPDCENIDLSNLQLQLFPQAKSTVQGEKP